MPLKRLRANRHQVIRGHHHETSIFPATINGHALSNPAASAQPASRSLTVGTYRGNNTTFSWNIPAAYFAAGDNTMTIVPISGNADTGKWLSASFAFDCVELDD
jgi:rhamnogalacturonan endolyase